MISNDNVGLARLLPGTFAEALLRNGTFLGSKALHACDRYLPPCAVADSRYQFIPVTRLGVLRPFAQPRDLPAHRCRRPRAGVRRSILLREAEQRARFVLVREAAPGLVPAHIVSASLEQCHVNSARQLILHRIE